MALNGDILGTAIASAVDGLDLTTNPAPTTEKMWQTIGNVIVDYIKNNAVVSTSVSTVVASPIPVQVVPLTGTGGTISPGSGTGSGTGTIS